MNAGYSGTDRGNDTVSLSRFVAVLLVFLLAGPPIGAVTVSLAGGLVALIFGDEYGMAGLVFYSGLLAIPLSWLVGGAQAAVAGIAFATFAAVARRPSIAAGIVGGFAAGLVFVARGDLEGPALAVVLAAHVAAAATCGAIAKSMLQVRRRDAA